LIFFISQGSLSNGNFTVYVGEESWNDLSEVPFKVLLC